MENQGRRQDRKSRECRRQPWRVTLAACVAFTGCAIDNRNPGIDPLLGNGGRSGPAGTIPLAPGQTPPPPTAAIPPPAPTVPSSNAALASGPGRPLDEGLRIGGDTSRAPDSRYGLGIGSWGAPNPNPGAPAATPNQSLPFISPPPAPPGAPAPGLAAPVGSLTSYEQAQTVLSAHGVNWQRLETWGDKGEWKFTCSIPNKQNAAISRNYEARANTPLDAIRAVIDKLDKDP